MKIKKDPIKYFVSCRKTYNHAISDWNIGVEEVAAITISGKYAIRKVEFSDCYAIDDMEKRQKLGTFFRLRDAQSALKTLIEGS